jgi:aspartyl-tRNA(Asn)/glutamyl-tRNA(Gln) amidotransferase subunit C
MEINNETVDKLAYLARLEFSVEEKESIKTDLSRIITWIDKLNELDTTHVEPLIYMSNEINVLRNEEVNNSVSHEDALLNAPKKDSDYFRVPKVLDK